MSLSRWVFLVELPGKGHGFLLPTHHIPQVEGQIDGLSLTTGSQVCRSSLAGLRGFLTALADKL